MLRKRFRYIRRKERTRFRLKSKNADRLRLCFYSSNKYIYSQVVDDNKNVTLTSFVTYAKDFKDLKNKNNIKAAEILGEKVAKFLIKKKFQNVFFDRGGCKYHGKVKAFAESARKNGLNF